MPNFLQNTVVVVLPIAEAQSECSEALARIQRQRICEAGGRVWGGKMPPSRKPHKCADLYNNHITHIVAPQSVTELSLAVNLGLGPRAFQELKRVRSKSEALEQFQGQAAPTGAGASATDFFTSRPLVVVTFGWLVGCLKHNKRLFEGDFLWTGNGVASDSAISVTTRRKRKSPHTLSTVSPNNSNAHGAGLHGQIPNKLAIDCPPATSKHRVSKATSLQAILAGGPLKPYGFGTMGLGICYPSDRPSFADGVALIHAALAEGCRFFDTADTYGRDGGDLHYVEKLLSSAFQSFRGGGDGDACVLRSVVVATKGGMNRARGDHTSRSWRMPKGLTADDFEQRARASVAALQLDRIPVDRRPRVLYQLHHPEAFGAGSANFEDAHRYDSVLKRAQQLMRGASGSGGDGTGSSSGNLQAPLFDYFGICNATRSIVKRTLKALPELAAVQNPLSVYDRQSAVQSRSNFSGSDSDDDDRTGGRGTRSRSTKKGVLDLCLQRDMLFIAFATCGGVRARDGRYSLAQDFPCLQRVGSSRHCIRWCSLLGRIQRKLVAVNAL